MGRPEAQVSRPGRAPGEGGSATVLMATAFVLVGVLAVLGLVITAYLAASRAVRGQADLVAISAAQAHADGHDACAEARRIAAGNRLTVSSCRVSGDGVDFVVSVDVARSVPALLPGLPTRVGASAHAGSVSVRKP